ncbi:ABC1 family-domain-containing protein [Pisolithus thermaeus]|nr:ABC1 family-domain-containing protein [Pisolithus thermaeus]
MLSRLVPLRSPAVYVSSRAHQHHFSHSSTASRPSRLFCYSRRTALAVVGLGVLWFTDKQLNASAVARNVRTLWTCTLVTLDYKLNFQPEKAHQIPQLHERVADRIYNLLTSNGGLYIKLGQAIGANAALMPRPMQDRFSRLFDDAPQIPYASILSVFRSEFGRSPVGPDGVFAEFDEQAVASASIAQVHRARLKSGEWVAVKIQKPDVSKQVEWDLGAFRIVMWMFESWFDMPVCFAVDFISNHLRQELDFLQEARNAVATAEFVATEPRLSGKVHIPRVYTEYSTRRVLTAEWVDGVRLSDRPGIRKLMGEDDGIGLHPPHQSLEGVRLRGGLRAIMQTMVELFSAQMFSWGWVHCDPHPGNIIIRPHPQYQLYPQLVLLDHGLYVRVGEEFRRKYAELWRALLATDWDAVEAITTSWGIGTPDLFASATLMRPVSFRMRKDEDGNNDSENGAVNQYERSLLMKERLKNFLYDTDKMPKELIFLGRNMRIVQGNNQVLGSPVNRIKITAYWASRSLTTTSNLTFLQRLREYRRDMAFRIVMFSIDLVFWASKLRQWIGTLFGLVSEGFEDGLERDMRGFAKRAFGVDVAPGVFLG